VAGEKIEIEGLGKLLRQLRQLDDDLVDEMKAINRAAADDVAARGRSKAPHRTGRLAASVRASSTLRSGVVRAGKRAVPYAGPVHFGWPRRHIRPNPFLWDALDDRRGHIEREYITRITRLVEAIR
jgi:HK97 gp10 family phage protein